MKPRKKPKGHKAVSYELIPHGSEIGQPMYSLLYELLDKHHEDLKDARIALAWCTSWKPDVDGRVTIGKCRKASDLDRELAPFDFAILLSKSFWTDGRVTDKQRRALLDHELCHAAVKFDDGGKVETDDRGRVRYRVRKHDIEEFSEIVARHGCYKHDLEAFAAAIEHARQSASMTWPSYSRLHGQLLALKITVPVETIATWSEDERREVEVWALLTRELRARSVTADVACPAPLQATVAPIQLLVVPA